MYYYVTLVIITETALEAKAVVVLKVTADVLVLSTSINTVSYGEEFL